MDDVAAYKGLVRPVLEYGSSVWDPHTHGLQEELEKVQNRAARFVTGNYVFETGSMTGILGQLKWESLKKRRKDIRLILLYKGLKGKARIATDDLIPKNRRCRNQHSLAFQIPSASKEPYKSSLGGYLLPPKPKSSFRHLKQGIQEFHRKYVLVPADKAANNVVVVCRLHYVNALKQELDGTRAYLETDTDEVSVVNAHLNDLPVKFSVCVNEGQDKLPTMYWLPKLHKRPYKARFIANSSPCTTTELSKLLTSCLTAIKSHVIRYCETVYETSNKNWFWSIKNSGEVLRKLKCRGFRATSLSTYDFSTLYTTLPHNLIKEKLLDLIEWTFKRALKNYGSLYLACNDRKAFFTSSDQSRYTL